MSEKEIICSWENCKKRAVLKVYNSTMTESGWLCAFHRRVALINLELYDKLHAPSNNRSSSSPSNPLAAQQQKKSGKSKQDGDGQWEKTAARKADAAAKIDVPDFPEPKKRV